MKKLLTLFAIALAVVVSSCSKFDDSAIWDKLNEQEQTLNDHEKRIAALEELCKQMNTNINALQTLVEALEKRDYITNVSPVRKDGEVIGYTISFADSDTITIYHGENGQDGADGKDGYTPQIGVMKDTDGIYYWTLDGEWLLDGKGNKIKAVGEDGRDGQDGTDGTNGSNGCNGQDGQDGEDGTDGRDGVDGVTPRLKIENDYWYVSYDEGVTWIELGKATGEDGADGSDGTDGSDGEDGDSIFASVTQDDEYVYFNLADGTMITLPKHDKENIQFEDLQVKAICCKNWDTNNDGELSYAEAAAVTDIGTVFNGNTEIIAFTEFRYFTGLGFVAEDAFNGCSRLWKIIIPETITEVRKNAFRGCAYLDSIIIPTVVSTLEDSAFYGCSGLKGIILPASINYIGSSCFYGCSGCLTVECDILDTYSQSKSNNNYCSSNNANHWLYGAEFTQIVLGNSVKYVGAYAFKDYSKAQFVIQNNNQINTIREYAFYGCNGVNSLPMNESLSSIGDYAFYGCLGIIDLIIPDSVYYLGKNAFQGCVGLINISIGNGISDILEYTFSECDGLYNVLLPNNLKSIGKSSFKDCDGLIEIIIPDEVHTIGSGAFYHCEGLSRVVIGKAVNKIGGSAFEYCSNIQSIYCKPTTPPAIYYYYNTKYSYDGSFPFNSNMTIYVPTNSFGYYKQYSSYESGEIVVDNWCKYESYLERYDFENNAII